MITPKKDLPLSIQEDMSMHSALSFHRRKCPSHIHRPVNIWLCSGHNPFPPLSPALLCSLQTSGYLFRREAWQRALLGKGRTPQAMAPTHEDQERIHSLWAHWHQHSIIAGKLMTWFTCQWISLLAPNEGNKKVVGVTLGIIFLIMGNFSRLGCIRPKWWKNTYGTSVENIHLLRWIATACAWIWT